MPRNDHIQRVLETAVQRSDAFVKFITRSWRPIVGATAALFVCSVVLLWITFNRPIKAQQPPSVPPVATSTPAFYRALDGLPVESASTTQLLPLGVMVENSTDAWPLSGVAKANVVFEAPVEGSITRFFLLFDPTTDSGDIGPVRSARPYYVDIADGFGALYAHVGGSPESLANIKSNDGFKDLDQFFNDRYFWRSGTRYAPHNVYTNVTKLADAVSRKLWTPSPFTSWAYEETSTSTVGASASTTIRVPYDGAYAASWSYDLETGLYTRSQNGNVQKDADGTIVTAKNLVFLETDEQVLDEYGRLRVRTTGQGDAIVVHDGKIVRGTWSRRNNETFRFIGNDGADIPLGRGKTWVSIVTSSSDFERIIP